MDDSPEFLDASNKPSPLRRELQLQGPRPTPLKIRKDSHKIKKPPIHPQPQPQPQQQQQHAAASSNQLRPPVIIYTVSPKVIHTNVNDFMTLVQRLTGSSSTSTSTSTFDNIITGGTGAGGGAISPAARFASIEKANSFQANKSSSSLLLSQTSRSTTTTNEHDHGHGGGFSSMEEAGIEISGTVERINNSFPGILSPVPSSLPPISPNFFSPTMMMRMDPSNNNSFSLLHDLSSSSSSPMFNGTSFFVPTRSPPPSPWPAAVAAAAANFPSPNPPFDLFNQFFDF